MHKLTKTNLEIMRRMLQFAVGLCCVVPIAAELAGIIYGPALIDTAATYDVSIDSHFRYLSGLLLGIGLAFVSTIPAIETKTARFQILSLIVFIGGLGRMTSLISVGMPDHGMMFGLVMELIVTPTLALCQYALHQRPAR